MNKGKPLEKPSSSDGKEEEASLGDSVHTILSLDEVSLLQHRIELYKSHGIKSFISALSHFLGTTNINFQIYISPNFHTNSILKYIIHALYKDGYIKENADIISKDISILYQEGSIGEIPFFEGEAQIGTFIIKGENPEKSKSSLFSYIQEDSKQILYRIGTNTKNEVLAYVDPLTNIGNENYIKACIEKMQRNGSSPSICCVHINDFKQICDIFGIDTGDKINQQVAKILKQICNELGGEVGRIPGSSDYIIAFEEGNEKSLRSFFHILLEKINDMESLPDSHIIPLEKNHKMSLSCGATTSGKSSLDISQIAFLINQAIYSAREAQNLGANNIEIVS